MDQAIPSVPFASPSPFSSSFPSPSSPPITMQHISLHPFLVPLRIYTSGQIVQYSQRVSWMQWFRRPFQQCITILRGRLYITSSTFRPFLTPSPRHHTSSYVIRRQIRSRDEDVIKNVHFTKLCMCFIQCLRETNDFMIYNGYISGNCKYVNILAVKMKLYREFIKLYHNHVYRRNFIYNLRISAM